MQELLNAFGLVLTEKQIIPSATGEDIDFGAVRAYMQAQGLDLDAGPQPARDGEGKGRLEARRRSVTRGVRTELHTSQSPCDIASGDKIVLPERP